MGKSDGKREPVDPAPRSTADFDRYTDDYREQVERSIGFIGQDHVYFVRNKVGHIMDVTRRRVGNPKDLSILDVGCGIGLTDRHLVPEFGRVAGADISEDSIRVARSNAPQATYRSYDGSRLPYDDDEFDISFAIGVLHHVPPNEWLHFLQEMARVTSPSGLVLIFEHNPYNPLTRLAVFRCEFDEGVVLLPKRTMRRLFADASLAVQEEAYILVLPWDVPLGGRIEAALKRIPLGAQYLVAGLRTRADDASERAADGPEQRSSIARDVIRGVGAIVAVLVATIGVLAGFLVPFVLLGRAGEESLGAAHGGRAYSLVLPTLATLAQVGLIVVVWVVAYLRKRARERP